MKILNQAKNILVNLDNIVTLAIADKECDVSIYTQENNYQIVLGNYMTPERAKEVFKDIIKALTNTDVAIYKMPEK